MSKTTFEKLGMTLLKHLLHQTAKKNMENIQRRNRKL